MIEIPVMVIWVYESGYRNPRADMTSVLDGGSQQTQGRNE